MSGRPPVPLEDYIGKKFNKLTIVADAGYIQKKRQRARMVHCLCECGNTVVLELTEVKASRKQACGCELRKGNSRRHSMTGTRVHRIWIGMRYRILHPNASGYANYGGRGIKYDPAWDSFEAFLADMGEPPADNYTLDRIDSNGDYCKANCRWATMEVQVRNRRNSVILEYGGRRQNLVDWASELGIHPMTLRGRLDKGWPLETALTTGKVASKDPRRGKFHEPNRYTA